MCGIAAEVVEYWQVLVTPRSDDFDAVGRRVLADIRQLGLGHAEHVRAESLYVLAGDLNGTTVQRIAAELLADPVTQRFSCGPGLTARPGSEPAIEVHYLPGVMDPVSISARAAVADLLATSADAAPCRIDAVRTAKRYVIRGTKGIADLERIATGLLANACIERAYVFGFGRRDALPADFPKAPEVPFELRTVPLRGLDAEALTDLSRRAHLFLSAAEMVAIRDHFHGLGRDPTDLELETLAQTWSEHCVHKTLKSEIVYRGPGFGTDERVEVLYDNLLAATIAKVTRELDRDWCLSVFVDNAGVIAFDDEYGIAFKVETHNHPSAIEPYGGAATGIGGCIRDIMGCGLGAKPIASTDVFCVAPPDFPESRLPRGVLHPQRVLRGVVAGVRDYGNRMGIPTVNGAVHFDERYLANPLVFCGSVGLIPRDCIHKSLRAGDKIVLVGGRTGRDGIHGATFSSAELTDSHADEFSHAVQIGNPIEEKKVLDALLRARDHESGCLFSAVTDCGAGGLSSAIGEMGEHLGAAVDLEQVPLKYSGLTYAEVWISEAQERMVLAVPPEKVAKLLKVFAAEEVETAVLGEFTGDGQLHVRFNGTTVGRLHMEFLHHGLPKLRRAAEWSPPERARPTCPVGDPAGSLLEQLQCPAVASKEWIIRQYDHQVQGGSVIKPLCGSGNGPSDAAVLRPRLDGYRGIALGCGLAPELSDVDPYRMAIASVDEALRNVVCVGGDPEHTAILDNFCWGGVDDAQALGGLVRACQGAHDAALAYGLPFISGKDSLNNQFSQDPAEARRLGLPPNLAIPGTVLISAVSIIDDVRRCVTMDLKQPGDRVILVRPAGEGTDLDEVRSVHHRVAEAIRAGGVLAAHDISDGGLLVALAEMCIAGGLGLRNGEWGTENEECATRNGRRGEPGAGLGGYCLEVAADCEWPGAVVLGTVTAEPRLLLTNGGTTVIDVPVDRLREAWQSALRDGPGSVRGG